jgi:hypothetical protein
MIFRKSLVGLQSDNARFYSYVLFLCSLFACSQAAVVSYPVDTATKADWRTAATLEADSEYGTDGYIVYGLNLADGVARSYDTSVTNAESLVSLPGYISDITLAGGINTWSGNGNFGQIENPNDPNNALINTSVIANGPDPYVLTITRTAAAAFRLTVICATGDGQVPTWAITMDDGSGAVTRTIRALASPNVVYQMFEIPAGSTPITISTEADVVNGWVTGIAFDSE